MMLHPKNADKDLVKLLDEAIEEVGQMTRRHFDKKPPTLRATIPAQDYDTDVLLSDALEAARKYVVQHRLTIDVTEIVP